MPGYDRAVATALLWLAAVHEHRVVEQHRWAEQTIRIYAVRDEGRRVRLPEGLRGALRNFSPADCRHQEMELLSIFEHRYTSESRGCLGVCRCGRGMSCLRHGSTLRYIS